MRDIEEYVKLTRLAAELGDSEFQNYMGVCCYYGIVVPQNYAEAFMWFSKAVEGGVPDIQCLPKDFQCKIEICRSASHPKQWREFAAYNNLGVCYYNGYGVTQNYEEAVKWYRKHKERLISYRMTESAAKEIEKSAIANLMLMKMLKGKYKNEVSGYDMFELGLCYSLGIGMPQDEKEAIVWYRRAAKCGERRAKEMLDLITCDKYGVPLAFIPFSSSNYAPIGRYFYESTIGLFFADLVEFSDRYLAVVDVVEKEAEDMCPKDIFLGRCHMFWNNKKRILKEKYGIIWHSPAEMNPNIKYD